MTDLYTLAEVFALLLGLCVGSFLNVCIARMPEDRSVVSPPSHCPACGSKIRPWDNIPIISWILLRAKCRDCGTHISVLYPVIELMVGLLFWLVFHRFVPGPADLDLAHLAAFGMMATFVSMLVALTFIDALDTLAVVGNASEFAWGVNWVGSHVSFDLDVDVSLFETNIRVLGGACPPRRSLSHT